MHELISVCHCFSILIENKIKYNKEEIMSNVSVRRCLPPCAQVIPEDDPHDYCLECLGEEHAVATLEDAECEHYESRSIGVLRSRLAVFEEGQVSASS